METPELNENHLILRNPNPNAKHHLQVTLTGATSRVCAGLIGSSKSLAFQVAQNGGGRTSQSAAIDVGDTGATDIRLAGAGVTVRSEESTCKGGRLQDSVDVGEVVALRKDVAARTDLEGVTGVVVPVVVDGVEVGVVLDLGGTATGLVEVVALEGYLVARAVEVHVPVVVAVAGGGVVGFTVDVVVGDRDTVVGFSAQDVVLATNASSLYDKSV